MRYVILIPALGHDYESGREVQQAWDSGANFQVLSVPPRPGRFINVQDAKANAAIDGPTTYNVRYKRGTMWKSIRV